MKYLRRFYKKTFPRPTILDSNSNKATTASAPAGAPVISQAQPNSSPHPPRAGEVLPPALLATASHPLTEANSNLPLQTPSKVQLSSGHADTDVHKDTLGSNLVGLPVAKFFESANNFSVNNSIMGENIQITHVQISSGAVLKEMAEHIIPGAQYDSSARDSPPRCHPGTRTQILKDVQARIYNPDLATRMVHNSALNI